MKYNINIVYDNGNEVISGDDINTVLQEVSRKSFNASYGSSYLSPAQERTELNKIKKEMANTTTEMLEKELQNLEQLLNKVIDTPPQIDWEEMKSEFDRKNRYPGQPLISSKPKFEEIPKKPELNDPEFKVNFSFMDRLSFQRKNQKKNAALKEYNEALEFWKVKVKEIENRNLKLRTDYEQVLKFAKENHEMLVINFNKDREEFYRYINNLKNEYEGLNEESVEYAVQYILEKSDYGDENSIKKNIKIKYNNINKVAIINYRLPAPEDLPRVKAVKYVQAKDKFSEVYFSDAEQKRMYQNILYQIVIRSLYEVLISDKANAIDAVVFNGSVKSKDKATGHLVEATILSISVEKKEFLQLNLGEVDTKECFKKLKGIASPELINLTPVAPILDLKKVDNRFVAGYEVIKGISDETNLASMNWEDFENLIRELFEKEFVSGGGEVKVTQASKDGGVDAVIFDPDPIRGGKIIVQAKRYTNVVGVAAVRDLYGTVINEGAIKGILVTTSDYGSDSIQFAKDKPLTLLNGNNLLHLLNKHGYKARINIDEAKKLFSNLK